MSDYSNDAQYDEIVMRAVKRAAAVGPVVILPVPGADLLAVGAVWADMAVDIAKMNGVRLEKESAAKVMIAVFTGAGAYIASVKVFLTIFSKIPGIGMLVGAGVNSTVNVVFTLWLGFALIDLFDDSNGKKKLEDYVAFLISEVKPRMGGEKVKRVKALIKRQRG